jgi:hypothetical protein
LRRGYIQPTLFTQEVRAREVIAKSLAFPAPVILNA